MSASRNGLNTKIRGFKGVGFGRALPAAFGFDNGFHPDGVNDFFSIPRLLGQYIPDEFCIEFWMRGTERQANICIFGNPSEGMLIGSVANDTTSGYGEYGTTGYPFMSLPVTNDDAKNHYVFNWSRKVTTRPKSGGYFNGFGLPQSVFVAPTLGGAVVSTIGSDGEYGEPIMINNFYVGGAFYQYNIGQPYSLLTQKLDEFRVYKKMLNQGHVISNYNRGAGNNPSETEHLLVWYKFQAFEMLDFSDAQDGSDIRLGVRDHSGNNNHAEPHNMVTDPVSGSYVLKPF